MKPRYFSSKKIQVSTQLSQTGNDLTTALETRSKLIYNRFLNHSTSPKTLYKDLNSIIALEEFLSSTSIHTFKNEKLKYNETIKNTKPPFIKNKCLDQNTPSKPSLSHHPKISFYPALATSPKQRNTPASKQQVIHSDLRLHLTTNQGQYNHNKLNTSNTLSSPTYTSPDTPQPIFLTLINKLTNLNILKLLVLIPLHFLLEAIKSRSRYKNLAKNSVISEYSSNDVSKPNLKSYENSALEILSQISEEISLPTSSLEPKKSILNSPSINDFTFEIFEKTASDFEECPPQNINRTHLKFETPHSSSVEFKNPEFLSPEPLPLQFSSSSFETPKFSISDPEKTFGFSSSFFSSEEKPSHLPPPDFNAPSFTSADFSFNEQAIPPVHLAEYSSDISPIGFEGIKNCYVESSKPSSLEEAYSPSKLSGFSLSPEPASFSLSYSKVSDFSTPEFKTPEFKDAGDSSSELQESSFFKTVTSSFVDTCFDSKESSPTYSDYREPEFSQFNPSNFTSPKFDFNEETIPPVHFEGYSSDITATGFESNKDFYKESSKPSSLEEIYSSSKLPGFSLSPEPASFSSNYSKTSDFSIPEFSAPEFKDTGDFSSELQESSFFKTVTNSFVDTCFDSKESSPTYFDYREPESSQFNAPNFTSPKFNFNEETIPPVRFEGYSSDASPAGSEGIKNCYVESSNSSFLEEAYSPSKLPGFSLSPEPAPLSSSYSKASGFSIPEFKAPEFFSPEFEDTGYYSSELQESSFFKTLASSFVDTFFSSNEFSSTHFDHKESEFSHPTYRETENKYSGDLFENLFNRQEVHSSHSYYRESSYSHPEFKTSSFAYSEYKESSFSYPEYRESKY